MMIFSVWPQNQVLWTWVGLCELSGHRRTVKCYIYSTLFILGKSHLVSFKSMGSLRGWELRHSLFRTSTVMCQVLWLPNRVEMWSTPGWNVVKPNPDMLLEVLTGSAKFIARVPKVQSKVFPSYRISHRLPHLPKPLTHRLGMCNLRG